MYRPKKEDFLSSAVLDVQGIEVDENQGKEKYWRNIFLIFLPLVEHPKRMYELPTFL